MDRRTFLAAATALVVAPEAVARSLGGTPVALVTADLESRIAVVHLTTGERLPSIPTRPGPRSIQRVGRTAVVAHTTEGALSIIDARTLEVRHVLDDFSEPRYTAASVEGRYAFVTDSGRGDLVVVDVLRGRILRRLAMGGPARHVSADAYGRLWTALGTKASRIAVVDVRDPLRPRLLGRIRAPFLAHDVGFAHVGRVVWVTSGESGELALFDRRTVRPVCMLPAGAPPQHVTFTERLAFVTSGDDGTLRTHDAATGRLLRTARIPTGSYNVQEGFGGMILMPSLSQGTLCIADGRGRLRAHYDVARSSHDACFANTR